mmetsp:Transcript_23393/g.60146  ORF Transcript_23393/g.60146 Transcript_23393/m.60146 type:complete len:256 (+) Transcript_23393:551-1318(+)
MVRVARAEQESPVLRLRALLVESGAARVRYLERVHVDHGGVGAAHPPVLGTQPLEKPSRVVQHVLVPHNRHRAPPDLRTRAVGCELQPALVVAHPVAQQVHAALVGDVGALEPPEAKDRHEPKDWLLHRHEERHRRSVQPDEVGERVHRELHRREAALGVRRLRLEERLVEAEVCLPRRIAHEAAKVANRAVHALQAVSVGRRARVSVRVVPARVKRELLDHSQQVRARALEGKHLHCASPRRGAHNRTLGTRLA